MKKYTILALTLILTATLLAGCRNPNMDMDMNPGNTSTPTGSTTEPITTQPATQPQTSEPATLPHTDPTEESSSTGTDEGSNNGDVEGRSRRRMPGM